MDGSFISAISRRAFLTLCLRASILMVFFKSHWSTTTVSARSPAQLTAYGAGLYGHGSYPGYRVNLPLIQNKEP
jgi:hypothetical protein